MWNDIKKWFIYSSEEGLKLPTAYDKVYNQPSISLLFANLSFYVALGSIIYLVSKDHITGTIVAALYAIIYFVLYMMRKLDKAKFNLQERSLELDSDDEDGEETK